MWSMTHIDYKETFNLTSMLSTREEVMQTVQQQVALANMQELLVKVRHLILICLLARQWLPPPSLSINVTTYKVTDKCFKKCITSPGSSMGSSDQKCVAMCMDRLACTPIGFNRFNVTNYWFSGTWTPSTWFLRLTPDGYNRRCNSSKPNHSVSGQLPPVTALLHPWPSQDTSRHFLLCLDLVPWLQRSDESLLPGNFVNQMLDEWIWSTPLAETTKGGYGLS